MYKKKSFFQRWLYTKYQLAEKDIAAIEKAINAHGMTEAVVKAAQGKVIVIQVEKKQLN